MNFYDYRQHKAEVNIADNLTKYTALVNENVILKQQLGNTTASMMRYQQSAADYQDELFAAIKLLDLIVWQVSDAGEWCVFCKRFRINGHNSGCRARSVK